MNAIKLQTLRTVMKKMFKSASSKDFDSKGYLIASNLNKKKIIMLIYFSVKLNELV